MEEELNAVWLKSNKAWWQLEQDGVQNLFTTNKEIRPDLELYASNES